MKVNGITLASPRVVKVYLPVADDKAVEFKFRPLSANEDFETVMSKPKPPVRQKPGGVVFHNLEDPTFKKNIGDWVTKKLDWEFLKSISATDDLEWATVKMDEPETWKNWRDEMEKVFGTSEINKVYQGFLDAQYISEEVMEKARARFLTGTQAEQSELSLSQPDEQ